MNAKDTLSHLLPKAVQFKMSRRGLIPPPFPIVLTFSVTNMCQSRCKTCLIWRLYRHEPNRAEEELSLGEIERVFRSMGRIYFFNISGGEPFLRRDLPAVVDLALEYLKPSLIHIPTNAISVGRIEAHTRTILSRMKARGCDVPLTVKPSFDGIGEAHDEIRGFKGNWDRLLDTVGRLKKLSSEFPNLHVELGTVVSNFNKGDLDRIAEFAHTLGVESYRNEIAEQRTEFFNVGDPITPTAEEYAQLIKGFAEKIRKSLRAKRDLAKTTECFRLVYYDLAARIVREERQVIPCYGGISNVHLTPYGDLWPCCVLGYDKPMGNLRKADYDFSKVWHSPEARRIRRSIRRGECACPLANQAYSNILCHLPSLLKVAFEMARTRLFSARWEEKAASYVQKT